MNFVVREAEVKLPISWVVSILAWITHFAILILIAIGVVPSSYEVASLVYTVVSLVYTFVIAVMAAAIADTPGKKKDQSE